MKRPAALLPLAALLLGTATAQPTGDLVIRFLDVGQGDAVLVSTPDGRHMLYDAGRGDTAAQRLRRHGVKTLDLAVMSQGDADHIGGFEEVAAQFRPRFVLNNGLAKSTQTYARVVKAFDAAGTRGLIATERTLDLGTSVKLQVLPAPAGLSKNNHNANSVGVLLTYNDFRLFLGGDAEPATTDAWAARYGGQLKNVTVHKALHHGSSHNDTASFLRLLNPEVITVGVGRNNYGHPTPEALGLYRQAGARVYRTDTNGTVTIRVKPDGTYTVTTEKTGPAARPAPTSPTTAPVTRFDPAGPDRDCTDFRTHAEAQAFYLAAGGPARDPHRLDSNDDGRACESRP